LEDFAKYFLSWINRWAEDGFEPIGRHWQIRADGIGDELELRLGDQLLRGSFVKLDEQGKLVMMGTDQIERRISVNEYFALGRE
jgi:BirA family biotin operon repressor/biotin-[acetyl-CoA-carboxylase] ligase